MKFTALLTAAALMTLGTLPAQAHHRHNDNLAPAIIGGAIVGGLLYYGTRDSHHDHHHHHHHHRRRNRVRVIDRYRYRGDTYRLCRRGNDVFYC